MAVPRRPGPRGTVGGGSRGSPPGGVGEGLFAGVLFFPGSATEVIAERGQISILGPEVLVLIGAAIWIVTFPVSFGI